MAGAQQHELAEVYPYHLIEFTNIGRRPKIKKIDIVATKWLEYSNIKKKCTVKYPPPPYSEETYQFYNTMLESLTNAMENWVSYTVTIKGRAKSLTEAHAKCEQLMEKESILTMDSEDDLNNVEQKATSDVKQAQLRAASARIKSSFINSQINNNCNKQLSTNNNIHQNSSTSTSKKKSEKSESEECCKSIVIDKLNILMIEIKELKRDSDFIKNEIQSLKVIQQLAGSIPLNDACVNIAQLSEKYIYNIPFKTVADFQAFNIELKENESLNKDVNGVLETSMDPSLIISKCIVSMLKGFLTKEVAMQYVAIKKKNNKFTMKNTRFFNNVEIVIKRRREVMGLSTSDKEIITSLSNVLSNSISWYKSNKTQYADIEDENSSSTAGVNSTQSQEAVFNMHPQIIATGTIKNGIVTLDKKRSDFSFVDANEAVNEYDSDQESFKQDYLLNFSTDL